MADMPNEITIKVEVRDKIISALAKAQGKFKIPELNRTAKVTKEGRLLYETHYADLQEIIECVRAPLAENGLCFIQVTKNQGNAWFLVLELHHESGQMLDTWLPLNVNQTNQQLGGTLTYLKRYQMSAFFGLAADFDDDGNSNGDNNVNFDDPKKGKQSNQKQQTQPKTSPPPQKKATPPSAPPKPEDVPQQFPPEDFNQTPQEKPFKDPDDFVMPFGKEDVKGKRLIELPESKLVSISKWCDEELKKVPPPTGIADIMEVGQKVKAFLAQFGVKP